MHFKLKVQEVKFIVVLILFSTKEMSVEMYQLTLSLKWLLHLQLMHIDRVLS